MVLAVKRMFRFIFNIGFVAKPPNLDVKYIFMEEHICLKIIKSLKLTSLVAN